jgi:hypothetical protein
LVEVAADCAGAATKTDTQIVASNVKPQTAWRKPLTARDRSDGVLTHPGVGQTVLLRLRQRGV